MTSPNISTEVTKPLISIKINDAYFIKGNLTELQRAQISPGASFKVSTKSLPEQSWEGKISHISDEPISSNISDIEGQII